MIAGRRKGGAKVQPTSWTLNEEINRTSWTSPQRRRRADPIHIGVQSVGGARARQHQNPHFLIQGVVEKQVSQVVTQLSQLVTQVSQVVTSRPGQSGSHQSTPWIKKCGF